MEPDGYLSNYPRPRAVALSGPHCPDAHTMRWSESL